MILLDTNVVSELVRGRPEPGFARFTACQPVDLLFVPSLAVAEIRYGLQRMPLGQRRRDLDQAFKGFLQAGFELRILDFDEACATGYATARAAREAAGRPLAVIDALIGGMALAHRATLATRNTRDFEGYGLSLVNPWVAP